MTVDWEPTTKDAEIAKEAFEIMNYSNDKVIVQTPEGMPNKFILQSKGYFGELRDTPSFYHT